MTSPRSGDIPIPLSPIPISPEIFGSPESALWTRGQVEAALVEANVSPDLLHTLATDRSIDPDAVVESIRRASVLYNGSRAQIAMGEEPIPGFEDPAKGARRAAKTINKGLHLKTRGLDQDPTFDLVLMPSESWEDGHDSPGLKTALDMVARRPEDFADLYADAKALQPTARKIRKEERQVQQQIVDAERMWPAARGNLKLLSRVAHHIENGVIRQDGDDPDGDLAELAAAYWEIQTPEYSPSGRPTSKPLTAAEREYETNTLVIDTSRKWASRLQTKVGDTYRPASGQEVTQAATKLASLIQDMIEAKALGNPTGVYRNVDVLFGDDIVTADPTLLHSTRHGTTTTTQSDQWVNLHGPEDFMDSVIDYHDLHDRLAELGEERARLTTSRKLGEVALGLGRKVSDAYMRTVTAGYYARHRVSDFIDTRAETHRAMRTTRLALGVVAVTLAIGSRGRWVPEVSHLLQDMGTGQGMLEAAATTSVLGLTGATGVYVVRDARHARRESKAAAEADELLRGL